MQSKLYDIRKQKKLTQQEVANFLKISRVSYGSKERDDSPFNIDEMFELSCWFGLSVSDIFLPRGNQNGYKETDRKLVS